MAWYYGTFSCGHEGRIDIIGPGKDREWKKERAFNGLCPECYRKKSQEEMHQANIEAAEKSFEMEFPQLTGSEKQVSWANTLRLKVFEKYEEQVSEFDKRIDKSKKYLEKLEKEGNPSDKRLEDVKLFVLNSIGEKICTSKEELSDSVDYAIQRHIEAKFWIDSRFNDKIFADFIAEYRRHKAENDIPEDVKQEESSLKETLTVSPQTENLKSGVVEIEYKDNVLYARYIKDDDFIKIVKDLNYKWEGVWCKKITEYTGTIEDRAAELGNILLANGFRVQFPNSESKEKAISSEFEIENDRWVKYNAELEKIAIVWKNKSDTLYENAKKLPGAKWSNGSMKVNIEFYKEIEDFAEIMGFSISQKAREKIKEYKQKEIGFETAIVSVKSKENVSDEKRIEKSLKSDGTIITDLLDE